MAFFCFYFSGTRLRTYWYFSTLHILDVEAPPPAIRHIIIMWALNQNSANERIPRSPQTRKGHVDKVQCFPTRGSCTAHCNGGGGGCKQSSRKVRIIITIKKNKIVITACKVVRFICKVNTAKKKRSSNLPIYRGCVRYLLEIYRWRVE